MAISDLRRSQIVIPFGPGGGIPEWLTNARVVDSPFEALTNMREVLSR